MKTFIATLCTLAMLGAAPAMAADHSMAGAAHVAKHQHEKHHYKKHLKCWHHHHHKVCKWVH